MTTAVPSLLSTLAQVPDFRSKQGRRYELSSILTLVCLSLVCGATSRTAIAEWSHRHASSLFLKNSPSVSTIRRVLAGIDQNKLEEVLCQWLEEALAAHPYPKTLLEPFSIDGKKVRGSGKKAEEQVHLLSVYSQRLGIILCQHALSSGQTEAQAVVVMLKEMMCAGRVFTFDAGFTYRSVAQVIVQRQGHYFMTVKGNQETLYRTIERAFQWGNIDVKHVPNYTGEAVVHGREERRTVFVLPAPENCWVAAQQIIKIVRWRKNKRTGVETRMTAYAITSIPKERATPMYLHHLCRDHWGIENCVHYVRDVAWREDHSTIKNRQEVAVMALLRNAVLSVLRLQDVQCITSKLRYYAIHSEDALACIGVSKR